MCLQIYTKYASIYILLILTIFFVIDKEYKDLINTY